MLFSITVAPASRAIPSNACRDWRLSVVPVGFWKLDVTIGLAGWPDWRRSYPITVGPAAAP